MGDNGELKDKVKGEIKPQAVKPQEPPKEFKIAEIWIKEEQLILDASPEFWQDKPRALGVLEMCKDIVKNFNKPKVELGNFHMLRKMKNRIKGAFGK